MSNSFGDYTAPTRSPQDPKGNYPNQQFQVSQQQAANMMNPAALCLTSPPRSPTPPNQRSSYCSANMENFYEFDITNLNATL
jgi:hypothetical protein